LVDPTGGIALPLSPARSVLLPDSNKPINATFKRVSPAFIISHNYYRKITDRKQALITAADGRFLSCQIFPESVKSGGRSAEQNMV
jgi:hypothetical protein